MSDTTLKDKDFEKVKEAAIKLYKDKKKAFNRNEILLLEDCFMLLFTYEYKIDEKGIAKILAFNAFRAFKKEIDKLLKGEQYSKEALKEFVNVYKEIGYFDILEILYTADEIEKIKNASL